MADITQEFLADLDSMRRAPMRRLLREITPLSWDLVEAVLIPYCLSVPRPILRGDIQKFEFKMPNYELRSRPAGHTYHIELVHMGTVITYIEDIPDTVEYIGNNSYAALTDQDKIVYILRIHADGQDMSYKYKHQRWRKMFRYDCGTLHLYDEENNISRLIDYNVHPPLHLDRRMSWADLMTIAVLDSPATDDLPSTTWFFRYV